MPHQDPEKIAQLVTQHLQRVAPPTVSVEVVPLFGAEAVLVDRQTPAMQAARRAYQLSFGVTPALTREGGGIPVVSSFQEMLGAQVILMGFGLPDCNAHAPNEKIHLPCFYRGIRTMIHFLDELEP